MKKENFNLFKATGFTELFDVSVFYKNSNKKNRSDKFTIFWPYVKKYSKEKERYIYNVYNIYNNVYIL